MTNPGSPQAPAVSHPLATKRVIGTPTSLDALISAWDSSTSFVGLLALFDQGFSEIVQSGWPEALIWLLDVADSWSDAKLFAEDQTGDAYTAMYRRALACKALAVVVDRMLFRDKEPVTLHWWLLGEPGVLGKLIWFLRPTPSGGVPNLAGDALWLLDERTHKGICWDSEAVTGAPARMRYFAAELWKRCWDYPNNHNSEWGRSGVDAKTSQLLVAARPQLLHLARYFGELPLLSSPRYWPDEPCKELLRSWAKAARTPGKDNQPVTSLAEAAKYGFEAAKVLLVVDAVDAFDAETAAEKDRDWINSLSTSN